MLIQKHGPLLARNISTKSSTFVKKILGVVVEAKGEQKEAPKVVEKWGEPDASRCVLAASLVDREFDPVSYLCEFTYCSLCYTYIP